jgi:fibronectin-binding autotransporter adhesin
MKPAIRFILFTCLLLPTVEVAPLASAQTSLTWASAVTSGTGAPGIEWATSGNWTPATAPSGTSTVYNLTFNSGSAAYTSDDNTGTNGLQVNQFNLGGTGTAAITIGTNGSGGTLSFVTSGVTTPAIADTSAANISDSIGFTATNATTISNTGGATLTLSSAIANTSGITFSGNSSSTINFSGSITGTASIGLSSGILLTGGNHQLSGATGTTAGSGGALNLNGGELASSLATGSTPYTVENATTIGAGDTVQFGDSTHASVSAVDVTLDNGSTLIAGSATSTSGTYTLQTGSSGVTFSSAPGVTLTNNATLTGSNGVIYGTGTILINGGAINSYTGATTVDSGATVTLSNTNANHYAISGSSLTINGGTVNQTTQNQIASAPLVIENGGSYNFTSGLANKTQNSVSTLTFGTVGGSDATSLTFALGSLTSESSTSGAFLADSGSLTINSSTPIVINLSGGITSDTYDVLSWTSSTVPITLSEFSATPGYTLSLSGDNLVVTDTGVVIPAAAYFNGVGTDLNTAGDYDAAATGNSANTSAPAATTNVFFSANRNTKTTPNLSASLTVNSVEFGAGTAGTQSGITVSSTNTSDSLTVQATNANGNTTGNGITLLTGGGNDAISAPVVLGSSQSWKVTDASSTLTVSGQVSDGGHAYALTKTGAGALGLSNPSGNIYTGGTSISAGTVYADNTGGSTYSAPSSNSRNIALTNTSNSATGSGSVTVASGGTLAGSGTIASHTGGIIVQSGGTLASGDVQSNAAPYVASQGLSINNAAGLSSALSVNAGAELTFALGAGSSGTFASPNTNSSYLSVAGNTAGEIGFTNTASGSGAITVNLVDLTTGAPVGTTLALRQSSPYLLIQAGSNSDYDLITSLNGVLSVDGNGYVVGVGTSTSSYNSAAFDLQVTALGSITPINSGTNYQNLQLYLENGDLEVVPEPHTWALMLGGFALLIALQRRNKFGKDS